MWELPEPIRTLVSTSGHPAAKLVVTLPVEKLAVFSLLVPFLLRLISDTRHRGEQLLLLARLPALQLHNS